MPLRMPIRHALIIANDFCYHLYIMFISQKKNLYIMFISQKKNLYIMFNLYSSTRAFDIHVVLIYIYIPYMN